MKIVILDGFALNPGDLDWDGFRLLGDVTVYDRSPAEMVLEHIGDADAIITGETPITREILDQCPSIRYIGVLSTGYDIIDTQAAKSRGIPVTNIPAYGTAAVSQFVFALLLDVCHHVSAHNDSVKAGEWANSVDFCYWKYPLIELADKTMGIIGFGRIGQSTANIAKSFGMNVLAHDSYETEAGKAIAKHVTLDELLAKSDVISLHCPLLPQTQELINKDAIAKMKDGVILINTSRGGLVNERHLADALRNGKVYAAALDVVSKEPITADNPLLSCCNCIITPHIAWAPKESRKRLMDVAAENLTAFKNGKACNVVNGVNP